MNSLRNFADRLNPAMHSDADATTLYHQLLSDHQQVDVRTLRHFLDVHLHEARQCPVDLPGDLSEMPAWMEGKASVVASAYREYLEGRHAGAGRQFFGNKAHALYFLRQVAPTKLVDGAWLYAAIKHTDDWRYHGLIRTYLEELGDGDPALNHVVLYRKLLADHDCAPTEQLEDVLYVQGAIQLALAQLGDEYLPELLGYNLGYEQLPLHLLITSFELNELNIDPYYFTLHVTIDNASNGHAHKAVQTVLDLLPTDDTRDEFIERLRAGYALNELGTGTKEVIASFDLENEVVAMLERKRSFGQYMHSDYCRLDGLTINQWLGEPGRSRAFLTALENKGWIKRNQDPTQSRFWQLIDGPGVVMFGVFSGYEMQLLRDWIAGDWVDESASANSNPFRARFRRRATPASVSPKQPRANGSTERLISLLSPSQHSTPEGLIATRAYSSQLAQGSLA